VGKEKLKAGKKQGYFLYGNHTQDIGDAVIPTLLTTPKDAYVIVHPNNVSMPYLGRVTPSMGALPLPDSMKAYRNFMGAVERRAAEGNAVVIYPEAHIWPYYTGIRPFTDDSFAYPVKQNLPVFCFTNTYQKRKLSKKPRIVTYVDGPFYPDEARPPRERRRALRDQVYHAMCARAKLNQVEVIKYVKKEEGTNG
jgi:1-acyl-sn-glycerol-3-phosphate acyltransferase